MRLIRERLNRVLVTETTSFKNLTVTPLVLTRQGEPDYLALDEALALGQVHIRETSEAGEVSELFLENGSERPVLLVDGEELVGAKQNRVLNLTVLAPAKTEIRIPVSCVEAGRWSHSTPDFKTKGRAFYATGRARKAGHITESLRSHGTRRSRQREVWDDIRQKSGRMHSHSETEAMDSLYDDYEDQLNAYVQAVEPVTDQVGAVFAVNGQIRGIELFDFPEALRKYYPKLVRSYALDALDEGLQEAPHVLQDACAFVAAVAAAGGSVHEAVGEGVDIRLNAPELTGGALEARDRVVHLSAFRKRDLQMRKHRERDHTFSSASNVSSNPAVLERLFQENRIRLVRSDLFDWPVPPKGPAFDFDRIEGMLLGIAVGDALGITKEGLLPRTRNALYGTIRDYLPNRYMNEPRGFPSDDTQLSFWSLEQMITDGEFNPERVARRFCSGHIFGIGQTVRNFIRSFKAGDHWYTCGPGSAGNGALMRIAPVLIPHLRAGGTDLWADAASAAMLTHNDWASTSSCVAFVGILWDLLDMNRAPEPRWWLNRYVTLARALEGESSYSPRGGAFTDYRGPLWRFALENVMAAYERRLSVIDACQGWYSGAYLLETLPSILYILMRHGHDPEEAIIRAVNDTKDSDTIAAIVGAAVGALHGREALPSRWIEDLSGRTTDRDDGRVFDLIDAAQRAFWT